MIRLISVLFAASLPMTPCAVLNTVDPEDSSGRGAKHFDPYAGPASGKIRLALQWVNGCAVDPNGIPMESSPGCQWPGFFGEPRAPRTLELVTGVDYFLNQLTFTEFLKNVHTDPAEATRWMKGESGLRNLDWSGLGTVTDEWLPSDESFAPGVFMRRVSFGHPAWQKVEGDSFLIEVLDSDGDVRSSAVYAQRDLLASSEAAGHTQLTWELNNVGAPHSPNDGDVRTPPPPPPGFPPTKPSLYRSVMRVDLVGALVPTNSFLIDGSLKGEGTLRLTWSQLPTEPRVVPVRFISRQDVPASCFTQDGDAVPCTHGLEPTADFSPPENGAFYEPGETFMVRVSLKDGAGNLLHPPHALPSWNESMSGRSNGLLYINHHQLDTLKEKDSISVIRFAGPRNAMRSYTDLGGSPFFQSESEQWVLDSPQGNGSGDLLIPAAFASGSIPGGRDTHPSNCFTFELPKSAAPGTYDVILKVHRGFMGERFTKTVVLPVQVGDPKPTNYPQQIGNCQMCHRGTLSLDNVRHGIPVDNVETCVACHNRDEMPAPRRKLVTTIHAMHMQSDAYRQPKSDCTTCHLTKASATRPSYVACASCHPTPHGGAYFPLAISHDNDTEVATSVYGTCAGGCHDGQSLPQGHFYPNQ